MTGELRMYAMAQAVEHVFNKNLSGDFVECGVWRGGNLILLNELNNFYSLNRKIIGYDTFDGMTKPNELDIDYKNNKANVLLNKNEKTSKTENIWCYANLEQVSKNISDHTNIDQIELIKGSVEKTLLDKKNLPERISILRLDTDFYESTKIELEILYPLSILGGILIIDDYGHWKGARKAVDEYFKENKHWMHYIDHSCILIIKEK